MENGNVENPDFAKRSAKRMSTCVPVCIVVRRVTYISLSLSIHIICGRIPRANTQWRTTGGLNFRFPTFICVLGLVNIDWEEEMYVL